VSPRWDWLQARVCERARLSLPWKVATTDDDGCSHSFDTDGICVHCGTLHPDLLERVGPFTLEVGEADQLEGAALWEDVTRQRDKLSARLSWLAANEGDPERDERAAATTRSRLRFEDLLRALATWAGVTPGEVAGLLLEQEGACEC
jgi:hypothetical protein